MTLAPRNGAPSWDGGPEGPTQVVGAGLLLGRRRSWWMLARALLNAVLAASYARVLAEPSQRTRARGGLVLMIG